MSRIEDTFKNKIKPTLQKAKSASMNFLYRVFGEENIKKASEKVNQTLDKGRNKFEEQFDTTGKYYNSIKNLYRWYGILILAFFVGYLVFRTNFLWLTGKMPSIEELQDPKMNTASSIISSDGVELGKYFAENRVPVDSGAISPWVFKALISTEDKRFNEHSGIDIQRMGSVLFGILTGGERGGGSTISQQLAKNLYNIRQKEKHGLLYYIPGIRTLVYKSKEWITAIQLERRFTKGEIATMYLNTVAYGNNSFGIKTAAKTYFNKLPADLNAQESAVLVGLLKATTYYNPIRNIENSKNRRNTVLDLMVVNNELSPEEGEKLKKTPIKLSVNIEENYDGQGNYFKVELANFIKKWAADNDEELDLYRDGLRIHTTIDSRMQTHAENATIAHMSYLQRAFDAQYKNSNPWTYESGREIPGFIDTVAKRTVYYKDLDKRFKGNKDSINYYMNLKRPMKLFSWQGEQKVEMSPMDSLRYYKRFLQCGLMAMEAHTGYIKAWVGGVDYKYFKYDHVKQGRRQPGSTFKPILYTAVIDGKLNLSPCDKRVNKPIREVWVENGVRKVWEPKNSGGGFTMENLTLRRAIAKSVNSVAVQLTMETGASEVVKYGKKMGITSPLEAVGSIGLGTSDVSLFEMVGAYGVFVDEGNYIEPSFVTRIEDRNGKLIAEFKKKSRPAISAESAYLMEFMLRGNVEEPGATGAGMFNYPALFRNGGQVAGKTGTTSNYSDAWYVGFTKDLVCGVWVGGDDRSIHFKGGLGQGAKSAMPMFGRFMQSVYTDPKLGYRPGPFPKPSVPITKPYLGCYSTYGEEFNYAPDSLFYEVMTDSLRQLNHTDEETGEIEVPKIDLNVNEGIQRKTQIDTSEIVFKKRSQEKPQSPKEQKPEQEQAQPQTKKKFKLFNKNNN